MGHAPATHLALHKVPIGRHLSITDTTHTYWIAFARARQYRQASTSTHSHTQPISACTLTPDCTVLIHTSLSPWPRPDPRACSHPAHNPPRDPFRFFSRPLSRHSPTGCSSLHNVTAAGHLTGPLATPYDKHHSVLTAFICKVSVDQGLCRSGCSVAVRNSIIKAALPSISPPSAASTTAIGLLDFFCNLTWFCPCSHGRLPPFTPDRLCRTRPLTTPSDISN